MQRLKPYPAYKDSGVPWLGEVPEHWETRRAKWLVRKRERPVRESDEVVTCFRDGRVTLRKHRRVRGFTEALKEIGYQGIRRGDLVVHAMDAFAGAVGVADSDGKGSPVYSVCEPSPEAVSDYYAFVVREMARSQWILALATGIRERSTDFRFSTFGSQPVPLPPFSEQSSIVRYLDYMDRRIQRYIRAKQGLIKLLEEQKQAVIHQAVTGQIDVRTGRPYPKYKPSGVEWLGDVPEHWEVSRVKNEFSCLNHRRIPLSATARGAMTLRGYDYYGASSVIDRVDEYLFDEDLLLIAEDGANLVLRNLPLAIIARGKFWVNNHAHILRPKRGNLEYLASAMELIDYKPWISGAAQPKLTKDRLMSIAIAVAPPGMQHQITTALNEETAHLRATIDRAHNEIALLREYRIRLISDIVTGKLDVREAAANLPDELEEEPLGSLESEDEEGSIPEEEQDIEEDP